MLISDTAESPLLPRPQKSVTSWLWLASAAAGALGIVHLSSLRLEHVASVGYETRFLERVPSTVAAALREGLATGIIGLAIAQAILGIVVAAIVMAIHDDSVLRIAADAGIINSLFLGSIAVMLNLPGWPFLIAIIYLSLATPIFVNYAVNSYYHVELNTPRW